MEKTPAGKGKVVDGGGFSICNTTAGPYDEQVANARLIAAAPELLHAACEAVEEIAYWHRDMLTEDETHPRGNGPARVHQLLVDAIRKATGAQP
jgi:lysophospholipase L1-like esterase